MLTVKARTANENFPIAFIYSSLSDDKILEENPEISPYTVKDGDDVVLGLITGCATHGSLVIEPFRNQHFQEFMNSPVEDEEESA